MNIKFCCELHTVLLKSEQELYNDHGQYYFLQTNLTNFWRFPFSCALCDCLSESNDNDGGERELFMELPVRDREGATYIRYTKMYLV